MVRDLRHPAPYGVKRPSIGNVVHQDNALRAPKIGPRDGPELLLARRVPDLELDLLTAEMNSFDLKINARRA